MWLVHTVDIDAPVEKVFAFLMDPEKTFALAPDDRAELVDVRRTDSGVGTSYRMRMKVAGWTVPGPSMEFTEVIPNRLIVDHSSMGLHGSWRYEFEPEGNGTRLTMRGQPRGLWRMPGVASVVDRVMGPRHEHMLGAMKQTLEQADKPASRAK